MSHIANTSIGVVKYSLPLFNAVAVLSLVHQAVFEFVNAFAMFEAIFELSAVSTQWLDQFA